MMRLRMTLIIFISVCFCLLQMQILTAYGEGVGINLGSTTYMSNVNSSSGGNVIPGNSGPSTPAASIPSNVGTQNINQNSGTTAVTSVSTNLPASNQFQQSTISNTQNNNLFQNPELTSGLIRTPNFNSLSEEPLLPQAEPYAVTICLSYNDKAAADCADKKTPAQASEKLAAMMLNKYLKGKEVRPFRIVLPSSMPSGEQIQLLRQIETGAIAIIEAGILKEASQQKQNILLENAKIARQEAQSGINWSHNMTDDKSSHNFHAGKAFSQLNNILISRR